MHIDTITVDNFKSLVDFRLDLAKFNCLIGLNGCGKSTVLQFMDFLAQQVRGDITGWLEERSWKPNEIGSRLTSKKNIDFSVELTDEAGEKVTWEASFNPVQLHCTYERISIGGAICEVDKGTFVVSEPETGLPGIINVSPPEKLSFTYQGSILSQLRESTLPSALVKFKAFFQNVRSLDLLSPELLRQRTRNAAGSLGSGGQQLSAFLHELGANKRQELTVLLKRVYPQLEKLDVRSLESGWKQLEITESFLRDRSSQSLGKITTEARHINDGMLRLIAVLAELQTDDRFVLFDEIENGINPELVEFLLDALVSASQQVLVTTHSPMVLNYLEDDVATGGVHYLYKKPQGNTQAIPFFSIPSLKKKLSVMGPGEAFVDTDLTMLGDEIAAMGEGP